MVAMKQSIGVAKNTKNYLNFVSMPGTFFGISIAIAQKNLFFPQCK